MPFYNRVVLADDDRDHAELFEQVLSEVAPSQGLAVAHSGEELLPLLHWLTPELLFLDLNLPGKNGLDCLQEIRNHANLKDLKVVVYATSARMSDIQRSYAHQADLYMVKPFNREHLTSALRLVLQKDVWQAAALKNHYYMNNRLVPFTAQL